MEETSAMEPTILVIFGVTGDLSRRYLLPALSEIYASGVLPREFKILGVSRKHIDDSIFSSVDLRSMGETITVDVDNADDYLKLKQRLTEMSTSFKKAPQIIFYLVVPPAAVSQIVSFLGQAGINHRGVKIMMEKPFGSDLRSAQELITAIGKYFKESQIYRIDHYLAKEVAQNIAVFLGSNSLFRNIWNNQFIEAIQIVAAEKISIEGRVDFYERMGALRDFIQSHLLQLAALTLMEPVSHDYDFENLPARRLKALNQIKPVDDFKKNVRRAQYKGYRDEVADPHSITETFVGLTLFSDDSRWKGVPITLATGKNLNDKLSEIRVWFKKNHDSEANLLKLRIQPMEAIEIDLFVKQPGYEHKVEMYPLGFAYTQNFERLPDAYERVLVDAIRSKQSLFTSSGEVLATWQILQPILEHWQKSDSDLYFYEPGRTIEQVLNAV